MVSVTPRPTLPPGKTRYPLYTKLSGSQGRSEPVRKISPTPGFDPRTVQPVAGRNKTALFRPLPLQPCSLEMSSLKPPKGNCVFYSEYWTLDTVEFLLLSSVCASPLSSISVTWRICLILKFRSAFAKWRKETIISLQYIWPHEITRLPLDGFSWNFVFEDFSKFCRESSNFD